MSNEIRKLRKRHPLNDPAKWTAEMRPPYFDAEAHQQRLDALVGLNREGKSILRVRWAPECIGLYGIPRYWISRVKDGEKWIYTSAPRFVYESCVEKSQYAPSWEALRFTMSEDEGFVSTAAPEDFYMFRWLCAEHESIHPLWGKPKCCQRAWEPNRLRCWGMYRAPNDYDLACVSKALQAREQSRFIDPYAPLSVADMMFIEANSVKQMAELAAKEDEKKVAVGRDFDKRNKWRLSNTMPTTKNRFFDQGGVILTDS